MEIETTVNQINKLYVYLSKIQIKSDVNSVIALMSFVFGSFYSFPRYNMAESRI